MKKTVLLLLIMCFACNANAQHDTAYTLPLGQALLLTWDVSKVRHVYTRYFDTIPEMSGNLGLTLRTERAGGDGSDNNPDTIYAWNHFEYMRCWVDKEMNWWDVVMDKAWNRYQKNHFAKDYNQYSTAALRYYYWSGVRAGIQLVIHERYTDPHFDFEFKSKKP